MSTETLQIVRELTALWERARESGEPPPQTELLAPTSKSTCRAEYSTQTFTAASTGWRD